MVEVVAHVIDPAFWYRYSRFDDAHIFPRPGRLSGIIVTIGDNKSVAGHFAAVPLHSYQLGAQERSDLRTHVLACIVDV